MTESNNVLSIYMGYDHYFSAHQLARSLSQLDRMYNAIYAGYTHRSAHDIPDQARMRIQNLHTGNSVFVTLVEGLSTVIQTGTPVLSIPVTMGITFLMGKILVSAAGGFAVLRKTWHEGTIAKYQAREAKRRSREPKTPRVNTTDKGREELLPVATMRVATEAAMQFVTFVEYSPNITLVRINDIPIVEKRPNRDEAG